METLQELSQHALRREPEEQAIGFEGHWYTWGELRAVADEMNRLLEASGSAAAAPVSLISRNHPAVVAALIGLIARGRNIRMIYAFQSPAGIARDLKRLLPAAFVLTAKDLASELTRALGEEGIATVVLDDMAVAAVPGLAKARPAVNRIFAADA